MDHEQAVKILESLRNQEATQQLIRKDDFMAFREVLIQQKDRVRFVGNAQKGGNVIFTYRQE